MTDTNETILVVDDDDAVRETLMDALRSEGFRVEGAADGDAGYKRAKELMPALLILDVKMPGLSGFEVCRRLRESPATKALPIILLTSRQEEDEVVLGLGLGADDYLPKPFRPKELAARVRRHLWRAKTKPTSTVLAVGPLKLDLAKQQASLDGKAVELTLKEFRVLWSLASHQGEVRSREDLLGEIGSQGEELLARNIDVHINSIRKKLTSAHGLIVSVRGRGYKIAA